MLICLVCCTLDGASIGKPAGMQKWQDRILKRKTVSAIDLESCCELTTTYFIVSVQFRSRSDVLSACFETLRERDERDENVQRYGDKDKAQGPRSQSLLQPRPDLLCTVQ